MKNYLAIVDFEATCCDKNSFPRHEMEIIEIGCVIVESDTFKIVDEFQSFIKPVRHQILTDFCKNLTSITQKDVDNASNFKDVLSKFDIIINTYNPKFCSWGYYDKKQLHQDCLYHNVKYPFMEDCMSSVERRFHINLKEEFAYHNGLQKSCGLGKALGIKRLKFDGTSHRGIDDARNIVKLLPYCF